MLKTADALETEIRQKTHAQLGGVVHNFQVGDNGEFARTGEGESELIVYDVVVSAEVLKDIE
jgi:2-polyprenyl-3-methyl-5-hydroxy-6-metoxy-1,4-benzoquinol methylase